MVLALAALAFGQVETALYGAVALVCGHPGDGYACSTDWILSKVAYIISDQLAGLCRGAAARAGPGRDAPARDRGAYTGAEKQVLLVAFKQREIVQIKRTVHELDPEAFLIVCDAHDVLGEGFGDYQKEEI